MIGYLIDMDGVIYRGGHLIPGADRFIAELRDANVPFRFLTNNSQRTRRDVATKLQRMGIDVEEEHVFTCAMATARFLAQQKPGGTAFVIGEGGLLNGPARATATRSSTTTPITSSSARGARSTSRWSRRPSA